MAPYDTHQRRYTLPSLVPRLSLDRHDGSESSDPTDKTSRRAGGELCSDDHSEAHGVTEKCGGANAAAPGDPADVIPSRWGFWAHLDLKKVVVGSEGMGLVDEGTWRDYVEVPEHDIVHVPDNISDKVAAQFIVSPWTAYGLLKRLQIPEGEFIVQSAAGSVLGRQVITLAKHYGIKTITVVRDEWIKPLTNIGADYVINSSKEDVKEITGGKGAYGALDPVATEMTRALASSVRDDGHIVIYGMLSGTDVTVNMKDISRQVRLGFFILNDFTDDLEERKETVSIKWELLSNKIINPLIGKTYPLEEFKEAIQESERDGRGGKVFLSSY